MGLYGGKTKIGGLLCGLIIRAPENGKYILYFEREHASLEQIEAINWRRPSLSGPCELPRGYGFDLIDIEYAMSSKTYIVTLRVREQYLGDITGYQAQINRLEAEKSQLEADNAGKQIAIQQLEGQLAEADETAIALYEELEVAKEAASPENEGVSQGKEVPGVKFEEEER